MPPFSLTLLDYAAAQFNKRGEEQNMATGTKRQAQTTGDGKDQGAHASAQQERQDVSTSERALRSGLRDSLPACRAAAAYALARVGDPAIRTRVRGLLADPQPWVRLRAAEGLLAAHDKAAIPALLALLTDGSADLSDRAESDLLRVAGDKAPLPFA